MVVKKVSIVMTMSGRGGGHGRGNIGCDAVDEAEMTEVMQTAVMVGRVAIRCRW